MAQIPDLTRERLYTGKSEGQMPEGRHLLLVNYVDPSESQAGNRIHKVELVGVDFPNEGKVAHDNFNIDHEVGRSRYKGFIAMLGFGKFDGLDTKDLIGKLVYAKIEHETVTFADEKDAKVVAKAVSYRTIPRDVMPPRPAPVVGQREGAKPPEGKESWRQPAAAVTVTPPAQKREYVSDEDAFRDPEA